MENRKPNIEKTVSISAQLYSEFVVKDTFYRFGDRGASCLDLSESGDYIVTFQIDPSESDTSSDAVTDLIADFHQALADQDLRRSISAETEVARNLILANAFSKVLLE